MSLEVESPQRSRFFRRGFRGLLNRRIRTEPARVLVTAPLSVAPPTHAMFQDARNTSIRNATFNIYGTVSGTAAPSQVERGDMQVSSHSHAASVEDRSPLTNSLLNSMSSSVTSDAFPAPQSSPEIYVRSLMDRNRGYPLWIPSPNMLLPVYYRASGVKIGDVGVITPEGGFSFFFNVCHEATHPINASRRLPTDFVPFATSLNNCDIEEFKEYSAGNYLSDDSVIRMDAGNEMFKTVLQTSARHAAVLMMPEPIYISKLQTLGLFRKYVHDNLRSWYRFIKVVLGRDVDNGDLRVVYGCRKSTAFGIATVNKGTTNVTTELTFSVDDAWAAVTGCKYRWHHRGSAETKAGPSLDENRDVVAFNEDNGDPINQCLFMSTIDVKFSEDEWQQIDLGGTVSVSNQGSSNQVISPSLLASSSPSERQDRSVGLNSDNGGRTRSAPLLTETSSIDDVDEELYYPTFAPWKKLFHPSDVLADYLLWAAPDATSVVVCTEDWGPCMYNSLKNVSTFISVVLSENEVCEDNGIIFLNRSADHFLSVSSEGNSTSQIVQNAQEAISSGSQPPGVIGYDSLSPFVQPDTVTARQMQPLLLDSELDSEFPSLVPAATSGPSAATHSWGAGPRLKAAVPRLKATVPKAPVFTYSFTVGAINLANSGTRGKPVTLGQVIKDVIAKYHVKIEAGTNQGGRQTTFHLKAESQKNLDQAKHSLMVLISPVVTLVINVPASAIASIIGPKGATLKQIRDQTGVRVNIPKRDALPDARATQSDTIQDDDEETAIPVTLVGPQPLAHEAQELLKQIIASKTSKATQRVRDIPAHILPFVWTRRAHFLSASQAGTVNLSLNASNREITASGDREAVVAVVKHIKETIEILTSSLTSVKISLPKRQHRLLTGSNADAVLAKSGCVVVVGKSEEAGDEITVWGQPVDLPMGLSAVMEQADSQYIHEYPLPGPASLSKQLVMYLSHVDYAKTLKAAHPVVDMYLPAPEAATYSIDLVGARADVDVVVKQISEIFERLIGGTRDVTIDWLLHRDITGKNSSRLKQFHEAHNINVYFPPESAESSSVLLVYDPSTPNASVIPDEKKKHLDEVEKEILKWARDTADVKIEKVSVEKRWHDAVVGNGGTTLNAIIGEDKALSIKVGADAGDATTEDVILVRGVSEDVDRAVKHIRQIVEDAKNDEIVNSYSTEFDIDKEYVGRIVGSQGAGVNKLRDQLGVRVDVSDDADEKDASSFKEGGKKKKVSAHVKSKVKITGRKENVEEAKRRILAQIKRLADETQEVLKIPAQYHSSLIGQNGKYAIRLEERYGVKITFPRQSPEGGEGKTHARLKADEVLVKGGKKGVSEAKAELLEAAEFEKDNNNVLKFTVPTHSVARILGRGGASINEIKDSTDAQIDVDKSTDETTTITLRGTKKAISAAKTAILAISEKVSEETTATLTIESKFHRTIIGAGGQGLKDLISRCGGPSDPKLQAGLIRFPRQGESSEEVRIRGEPKLVQGIKDELESILVTLRDRVVLGVGIPRSRHNALIGRGGSNLNDIQNTLNVQIQFPGSRSYSQLGEPDNAAELGAVDAADLVKVSGPRAACEQAIAQLQSNVDTDSLRGFRSVKAEFKPSFKRIASEVRAHASSTPRGSFPRQ